MANINPYFESQMCCSPFTYYVGGTRHRLSAAAKTATIFLTVILGIASFGLLALPVFYVTAGAFRHSERRRYLYPEFPYREGYRGHPSVSSTTIYNLSDSYRPSCFLPDYGIEHGGLSSRYRSSRHPGPEVSAVVVPDTRHGNRAPGHRRGEPAVQYPYLAPTHQGSRLPPAPAPSPSFSRVQPAPANFGRDGGVFGSRGVPARDLHR